MYVINSNKGLGGNWDSETYISNGGQQKKQLTDNTEHVTQKTTPRAQAPEVCEKTFSTHFVPQPVENTTYGEKSLKKNCFRGQKKEDDEQFENKQKGTKKQIFTQ